MINSSSRPLSLFFTILFLTACKEEAQNAPPPPTVYVATPLQREVRDWNTYIGRFEAIENAEIMPRISGQIDRIYMSGGQNVERGDPLFRIDPRPFEAALAEATAELERAQAIRLDAASNLDRAQALYAREAISQEQLEKSETDDRAAAAMAEGARAAVSTRELELSFTTIRAPFSGRLTARTVSTGDYVNAGATPLTRIVSMDPIWFRFDGTEKFYLDYMRRKQSGGRSAPGYAPNNAVEISLMDEDSYRWRGRMEFVDAAVDPTSGTIDAFAVLDNPDGFLTSGMFGRARLQASDAYNALLVPPEIIITDQNRRLVFVVNDNDDVIARPVETGPLIEGLLVLRNGVAPTDRVIIDGFARVQPGMKVSPQEGRIEPPSQMRPAHGRDAEKSQLTEGEAGGDVHGAAQ